jgi:hypothetical protein
MRTSVDADRERLRRLFRQVLAVTLTAGASSTGCSSFDLRDERGFVPVACGQVFPQFLAQVSPNEPVDYAELVFLGAASIPPEDQFGSPCSSATDQAGCLSALATAREATPVAVDALVFGVPVQAIFNAELNTTRGDTVTSLMTRREVIDFLGPIDTPSDAMLLAEISGFDVTCDRGGAVPTDSGYFVQAFQYVGCNGLDRFILSVTHDGQILDGIHVVEQDPTANCVIGRRPAGLCRPRRPLNSRSIGGYLAQGAALERASVDAFEQLGNELRAHGAPSILRREAAAAAVDETRHARTVGRLARRHGASVEAPRVRPLGVRSLEDLAVENAVEGCIRETFGALVAQWQARHAADPMVRRAYRRIAEDELRHAALGWSVARWAEPLLDSTAQRRVATTRRDTARSLLDELAVEPSAEVCRVAGVPNARDATQLAQALLGALGVT